MSTMSRRHLEYLFNPKSVALIGASDRPHSVGATVMRNLLNGGFGGPLWPVNLKHPTVAGIRSYRRVADLPAAPDLAVLCTPAPSIPALIGDLGARGTRAAVVLSAGLDEKTPAGQTLASAMLEAAGTYTLRILGPNCIGLLVPGIGLNASFAHIGAKSGTLAFVAQSGALTTAMLDWACAQQIGFSHFVSLGNAADVDFGDLLDYLGTDLKTRAILLYIESITHARKFMSAARAAARNKPVIVVKAGRTSEAARAAHSHTGALAGADGVYEAAFRRAGVLRVETTRELFDAAELLSHPRPYCGPRLAIVSNGGGLGVLATDALIRGGGQLARFGTSTSETLQSILASSGMPDNPLDIGGDARPERYLAALGAVLGDPDVDATLVIHAPTAVTSVAEVAAACLPVLARARGPTLACWMGREGVKARRTNGTAHPVPVYSTPEEAVGAMMHVVRYHESQALLLEVPASISPECKPDIATARTIIARALTEGRYVLTEPESKGILAAYDVPVVETRTVRDAVELPQAAMGIGYPVALKILSPDISHKSEVGGVVLDLESAKELQEAAATMHERCRKLKPDARIEGFTLQKMIRRPGAHELIVGIALDATFGPTILFGQGGTAVEVIADRALALPPLNMVLARDLISQTRIHRVLSGYRDRPPADFAALEQTLIKVAQLAADLPELVELDINPLLTDERGVIALDARIAVQATASRGTERFAIRPYPCELEETAEHKGLHVLLRPIRPEDFDQHRRFLARITPEDLRTRFFSALREVPARDLAHLTQIDYERQMAFIAAARGADGREETLGVARACTNAGNTEAEFAVLVRSDLKQQGLGRLLLQKLIRYCRARGTLCMKGEVLSENVAMLRLAATQGFRIEHREGGVVELALELRPSAVQGM
jgi:acetyltransferase